MKIIYIDFSFIITNKATRSQQFISHSDFTPVTSIFTAAVSQHSGAPPRLSIFVSVRVRPIDFELLGFFLDFFHPKCMDFLKTTSSLLFQRFLRANLFIFCATSVRSRVLHFQRMLSTLSSGCISKAIPTSTSHSEK